MRPGQRPGIPSWFRLSTVVAAVTVLLAAALVSGVIWATSVYQAEPGALGGVYGDGGLRLEETDNAFIMAPTGRSRGVTLLFFPGARVEARAYLWKLSQLPANGVTVVVAKPRLNLALLDSRSVDAFTARVQGANRLYLGGHSMGGVRACQYGDDPRVLGVVLMASYCSEPVTRALPSLTLYGANDRVLDRARAERAGGNLPKGPRSSFTIPGANHASFGNYGAQDGDGPESRPAVEIRNDLTAHLLSLLR